MIKLKSLEIDFKYLKIKIIYSLYKTPIQLNKIFNENFYLTLINFNFKLKINNYIFSSM